ncbi:MAG: molybdenum cofactor biosynthesis protein B [Pirellulales bacterium]
MSESTQQHRAEARKTVRCAVVTVSDTRTLETDRGGLMLAESLAGAGHTITRREIVPDDQNRIRSLVEELADATLLDAILITGGTGIAARDQTYETVSALLTKTLPGYGELFRMLSYEDIGPAAMLSRTIGGVIGQVVLLTMPGSTAAVRLALDKLILPELAHVVHEARK